MLEYETFCYMQNQKTGSTFVQTFLKSFCDEALINHRKHLPLRDYNENKFYFTNVREPMAMYRSLYAFGLDGKGAVYLRIKKKGRDDLYNRDINGFSQWLDFVLKPENAGMLSRFYTPEMSRLIGFMTWRFLLLACGGFIRGSATISTYKEITFFLRERYRLGAVLRQENLRKELSSLVESQLSHAIGNMDEALEWLEKSPKVNQSISVVDTAVCEITAGLKKKLQQKEIYLYRKFYPEELNESTS